jgi:hypothetical protein
VLSAYDELRRRRSDWIVCDINKVIGSKQVESVLIYLCSSLGPEQGSWTDLYRHCNNASRSPLQGVGNRSTVITHRSKYRLPPNVSDSMELDRMV